MTYRSKRERRGMTDQATKSPGVWVKQSELKLVATAEFISSSGTGVSMLALPTVAVLILHAGPLEAASLLAAELAPAALLGPYAGSLIDRLTKIRWAMVGSDIGRGLALLMIPLLDAIQVLNIWHIYMAAAIIGGLTPFSTVGSQSIVPKLVSSKARLPAANSLMSAAASLGLLVGPALGGILIGSIGAVNAMYVDAGSYAISALLLCTVRERATDQSKTMAAAHPGVRPALHFVMRQVLLRRLILGTAILNVSGAAVGGIYVLFAYRRLGLPPESLGITFSFAAVAGIGGAALAPKVISRYGLRPVILVSSILAATALFLIPSAVTVQPMLWLIAYQLLFTSAATVLAISLVTVRQLVAPADMRGRVNAFAQSVSIATIPVGALLGGAIANWIGLLPTLVIFALLASLGWLNYARATAWEPVAVIPDE